MTARRKPQPQIPPAADEAVRLLRQIAATVQAMDVRLVAIEARQAAIEQRRLPPAPQPVTGDVILASDLLELKDAVYIAGCNVKTMRDWRRKYGIGYDLHGKPFVMKSKLLAHIAATRPGQLKL